MSQFPSSYLGLHLSGNSKNQTSFNPLMEKNSEAVVCMEYSITVYRRKAYSSLVGFVWDSQLFFIFYFLFRILVLVRQNIERVMRNFL